uniref:DUF4371 domain-containing protein n=1 Tax=Oryza brachyantha TaxID=4533 RepID=J3ME38_ORYBR
MTAATRRRWGRVRDDETGVTASGGTTVAAEARKGTVAAPASVPTGREGKRGRGRTMMAYQRQERRQQGGDDVGVATRPRGEEQPLVPTVDEAPTYEQDTPPIYDVNRIEGDPRLSIPITSYPINEQDVVRRAYILKGLWQQYSHDFPTRVIYGLAFRGHDESDESSNSGNFLELLKWLAENNEEVDKVVLKNAPGNCILTSATIQRQIIECCADKTTGPLLADGCSDVSHKEQLALCLHYVDKIRMERQRYCECNALVKRAKERMQKLRSNGWEDFYKKKVISFCTKHNIMIPRKDGKFGPHGGSARFYPNQTNDDHFRRKVYLGVIDKISQELDNRFDEVNMELLVCMSAFNPCNSFASYDAQKIIRLAKFYPKDFTNMDFTRLEFQLDTFIDDIRKDDRFENLKTLGELSIKLVETNKACTGGRMIMDSYGHLVDDAVSTVETKQEIFSDGELSAICKENFVWAYKSPNGAFGGILIGVNGNKFDVISNHVRAFFSSVVIRNREGFKEMVTEKMVTRNGDILNFWNKKLVGLRRFLKGWSANNKKVQNENEELDLKRLDFGIISLIPKIKEASCLVREVIENGIGFLTFRRGFGQNEMSQWQQLDDMISSITLKDYDDPLRFGNWKVTKASLQDLCIDLLLLEWRLLAKEDEQDQLKTMKTKMLDCVKNLRPR